MSAYIYNRIEREKDGKKLNITIQQVTPELIDAVVQHMVDHFLEREPLCSHSDIRGDSVSLESFRSLWRLIMESGASIVALLDEGEGAKTKVIGANATSISRKSGPPLPDLPGESYKYVVGAVVQITEEADLWERYGVDSYLSAFGLSVHRDYHGIGLGEAILNAREKVCEKFGVTMTETVFTASASQYIASKIGFETVLEYPYKDYNFTMSNIFRDLDGKISIMVKRYKN